MLFLSCSIIQIMFAAGAFKGCVNYLVPLVGSLVLQNIFVVPIEMTSGRGINIALTV